MAGVTNTLVKKLNTPTTRVVYYTGVLSDTTNPTAYVLYDSSDFTGTDPLTSKIMYASGHIGGPPATGRALLLWDASTDVAALSLPVGVPFEYDFHKIGGLKNTGGSGITGDILFTTTGLTTLDAIHLILVVTTN